MYLQKIIRRKRKILFECQSPGNFSCNQNCLPQLLRRRTNKPQLYGLIRRLGVYSIQIMMAEASLLINMAARAVNVINLAIWFLPPVPSRFSSPFFSPVLLCSSSRTPSRVVLLRLVQHCARPCDRESLLESGRLSVNASMCCE